MLEVAAKLHPLGQGHRVGSGWGQRELRASPLSPPLDFCFPCCVDVAFSLPRSHSGVPRRNRWRIAAFLSTAVGCRSLLLHCLPFCSFIAQFSALSDRMLCPFSLIIAYYIRSFFFYNTTVAVLASWSIAGEFRCNRAYSTLESPRKSASPERTRIANISREISANYHCQQFDKNSI